MLRTNSFLVPCPGCRETLPPVVFNTAHPSVCPGCGKPVLCATFPALLREQAGGLEGELILNDADAACFYHTDKKAATVCDSCGRFLCDLCDVAISNRHLCPACTDVARKTHNLPALDNERVLHDDIALSLAILPVLAFPVTLLTAPFTIYYTIRHWKSPASLMPRTRVRFVAALLIATIQIICWAVGLVRLL